MRTTVTIDDDVFEAAQAQARASGKRLGEVLSLLARRGLKTPPRKIRTVKSGMPVFKVSPNARVIPSSRASELMNEEAL